MTQKYQLKGVRVRIEKKNGIEILETRMVENRGICKKCQKAPRAEGSSHCRQCSLNHKGELHSLGIIARQVQKQRSR